MGVVLFGHADVRMSKVGRNYLQRRASHNQMRRIGVAEDVKRGRGRDASGLAGLGERSLGMRLPPSITVRTGKQ